MKNNWNSNLYDKKHSYVFKYGEDLLALLNPKHGERILDLGSGTGHLTKLIADSGAQVIGIDSSQEMIDQSSKNYPSLNFQRMDATNFSFAEKFDAVFSNAVLHWIFEKEKVVKCISEALKEGGRFVAEFGGKDNIKNIVEALNKNLRSNGYQENADRINWYFPSIGEYASLLEKYGLEVEYAVHFNRDTFLDEGVDIIDWLEMFGIGILAGLEMEEKQKILTLIKEDLSSQNKKDGRWFIDYKRLRISVIKKF